MTFATRHRMHTLSIAAPLLCAASAFAQEAKVTVTPAVLPAGTFAEHGAERWVTVRAVDAIDGRPLADAELLLIAEHSAPIRGEFWWQMRATADVDGFIALRVDAAAPGFARWHLAVVRAPGHAAVTQFDGPPSALVRLPRAINVPVCIRNEFGQPMADALLGVCGGCGHTPDLVHARSDAAGIAVLRGADFFARIADLYVEHPQLHLGYLDNPRWFPGERPFDFFVEPSQRIDGVVVDAEGKPCAGAFVGVRGCHRGPWTRAAADGSFHLFGSEPEPDMLVRIAQRAVRFEGPLATPVRLQLPPVSGEGEAVVPRPKATEPPEPPAGSVAESWFEVLDAFEEPISRYTIVCVGPAPSRDVRRPTETVRLPKGHYDVTVRGDDHATTTFPIDVTEDGPNHFVLRPPRLPGVTVRVLNTTPEDEPEVLLISADDRREIDSEVASGWPIALPDGPLQILLRSQSRGRRLVPVDRDRALAAGTVRVAWFPPTRIEGRIVNRNGAPTKATLWLQPVGSLPEAPPDDATTTLGAIALTSHEVGTRLLIAQGEDLPGPRVVPIVLPPRGDDAFVDVGTIVFDAPPRLTVLDAAGQPLTDTEVGLVRTGWHRTPGSLEFPLVDGAWCGPDPRDGDGVVVHPPDAREPDAGEPREVDLAARFALTGSGPWELRLPDGEIEIDVRDAQGEFVRATVFVGSECVTIDTPTRLRRLSPGPQRLFVAADDHQSAIVDVTVPASGRATVKVVLPKR